MTACRLRIFVATIDLIGRNTVCPLGHGRLRIPEGLLVAALALYAESWFVQFAG